ARVHRRRRDGPVRHCGGAGRRCRSCARGGRCGRGCPVDRTIDVRRRRRRERSRPPERSHRSASRWTSGGGGGGGVNVAVLVVTWNSAATVGRCIRAVRAAAARTTTQILVWDNASRDTTV